MDHHGTTTQELYQSLCATGAPPLGPGRLPGDAPPGVSLKQLLLWQQRRRRAVLASHAQRAAEERLLLARAQAGAPDAQLALLLRRHHGELKQLQLERSRACLLHSRGQLPSDISPSALAEHLRMIESR